MDTRWLREAKTPEDKDTIRKIVKGHRVAYEDLDAILRTLEETVAPDYDCPSWSHKQADVNGANRMLRSIRALINIKDN